VGAEVVEEASVALEVVASEEAALEGIGRVL
jgi:hypothetical protein